MSELYRNALEYGDGQRARAEGWKADAEVLGRCVGMLRSFLRSGEALNVVDEANLAKWLAAHAALMKGEGAG